MTEVEILKSTFAAALVVVSGGIHALCFALARLRSSARLRQAAWLAYAVLAVSSLVLADALDLSGAWLALIVAMLVGYLLAPRAIWLLTAATHDDLHGRGADGRRH